MFSEYSFTLKLDPSPPSQGDAVDKLHISTSACLQPATSMHVYVDCDHSLIVRLFFKHSSDICHIETYVRTNISWNCRKSVKLYASRQGNSKDFKVGVISVYMNVCCNKEIPQGLPLPNTMRASNTYVGLNARRGIQQNFRQGFCTFLVYMQLLYCRNMLSKFNLCIG